MPASPSFYIPITAALASSAAAFTIWKLRRNGSHSRSVHIEEQVTQQEKESPVQATRRDLLPNDLDSWRDSKDRKHFVKEWERTWNILKQTLSKRGYTLWERMGDFFLVGPGYPEDPEVSPDLPELRKSYGFGYVLQEQSTDDEEFDGSIWGLCRMQYRNGLYRVASSQNGVDVVIRVVVVRKEGQNHLDILKKIATGPNSFCSNNHTLPMLDEIQFEDIVLGVFPKVGQLMSEVFGLWPKNSVGDILEMIMQMLEALEFIHRLNIAHRDAFIDNFLVQWHPESMLTMKISPTRPRVYLIDFEVAVQFPEEYEERQCVMTGLPLGGSFTQAEQYCRPKAPECLTGELYSPFKLDVWQLGQSLSYFESGISSIDSIFQEMAEPSSSSRSSAGDILNKLKQTVYTMSPESLLIYPQKPARL